MIKKIILLSALGFSLTGCVMAPYDDRPHYSGGYNSYDRPHWNNGATHRPNYRPNYRLIVLLNTSQITKVKNHRSTNQIISQMTNQIIQGKNQV